MPIQIQAAAVTGEKTVTLQTLETPDLRSGEALIKVHAVALCTLEQRVFRGGMPMPLPFIGGHEAAGEVAALGSDTNESLWPLGTRVAVRLLYNCGECFYCRTGHTNMCVRAQKKPVRAGLYPGPGGLCNYIIVNTNALYKIADSLPYAQASLTEPLACCVHSVLRANIGLGDTVVVIGGGIMGMLHVLLAKRRGARVVVSEVDAARRALAEKLGADVVFDPTANEPVAFVKAQTDGRGAEVVFNTTAIAAVVPQAIAMTAPTGRMVQYSSLHPDAPVPVSPQMLHGTETVLTGSISPGEEDFFTANRLLNAGIIDVSPLIAAQFPLQEVQKAFEAAITPGTYRVVVTD